MRGILNILYVRLSILGIIVYIQIYQLKTEYSVSNHVEVPESRFMSACFDLENEYKAVL